MWSHRQWYNATDALYVYHVIKGMKSFRSVNILICLVIVKWLKLAVQAPRPGTWVMLAKNVNMRCDLSATFLRSTRFMQRQYMAATLIMTCRSWWGLLPCTAIAWEVLCRNAMHEVSKGRQDSLAGPRGCSFYKPCWQNWTPGGTGRT